MRLKWKQKTLIINSNKNFNKPSHISLIMQQRIYQGVESLLLGVNHHWQLPFKSTICTINTNQNFCVKYIYNYYTIYIMYICIHSFINVYFHKIVVSFC